MKKLMLAFALLLPLATSADAAMVVTTCGTLPTPYAAGSTRSWTVNTNGQLCTP